MLWSLVRVVARNRDEDPISRSISPPWEKKESIEEHSDRKCVSWSQEAYIVRNIDFAMSEISYQYKESWGRSKSTHSTGFIVPAS